MPRAVHTWHVLDPDDRYRPHFLNRTVPILEENRDVGLVFGRIAMINETGVITDAGTDYPAPAANQKCDYFVHLLKKNDLPAPTVLARREAWALGLPIPSAFHFNDWYLSLSIAQRWPFYFINEVLADYRIHQNNMHSTMIKERSAEPIIMAVLQRFLDSVPDKMADRRQRNEIYAAQYRQLADQYFGAGLLDDARRCYWEALRRFPYSHARTDVLRHLLGCYLGQHTYELVKNSIKGTITS